MSNKSIIKSWEELNSCKSDTHYLEIDLEMGRGWVKSKAGDGDKVYLSTHSFYGSCCKDTTKTLQERGFNVEVGNWDK